MRRGGGSIQIARLFGIRIGASPSWFIVFGVLIFLLSNYFRDIIVGGSSTGGYFVAVAAVMLFFASIVLHELGHALVARRLGIGISGIDLWFFGGIAKMSRDSDSPGTEFKIAIAGPAVTFLIAALCVGLCALLSGGAALDVIVLKRNARVSPELALLGFLALWNAALLVFNLIPAFPLDGGRLARATVWAATGDRNRATRVAGRIGEGFAYLLLGLGIFIAISADGPADRFNGIYLAAVGWFIAQGARAAIASVAFTERIDGITVADIMDTEPVTMPATTTVLRAQEEFFLRYRWAWFAVVDDGGRFVGVVSEQRIDAEIVGGRPALEVSELVEPGDADRWRVPSDRPLESLLGDEQLRSGGALMAVDADGVLRGVVTLEQVRRALSAALPQRLA
ncbi:MAG TPA: site-2 protease family protein [Solirubrobacteraceae bacterium]|jgi:Zn-dependent protease|nr:site-2 protease family protein [Solirubrobacteraceae bacterium]